jgi:hypothetical protein
VTTLTDIASVVRSKNTSPFTLSLDIIFKDRADYETFKHGRLINEKLIASLYGLSQNEVLDVIYFDPAAAIKVCLLRAIPSGAPGDRDVYGAQQHAPLLGWEFQSGPAE